jgi:hypothetical protein
MVAATSELTYSDRLSTSIRGLDMVVATNLNSLELVAAIINRLENTVAIAV